MAAFHYKAITLNGRVQKGVVEADGEKAARAQLRARQCTPLDLKQVNTDGKSQWISFKRYLSTVELATATRQMGTFIQAGIPLDETLQACAENTESRKVRAVFLSVRSKVMEGSSLANAMEAHHQSFPSIFISTIAAGEKSGGLGVVLDKLADYTEASAEFRQRIGNAMVYPVILVVVSLLIVTGLLTYVVPDILEVFEDAGQTLPPLTEALMKLSGFISQNGLWLIALCALSIGTTLYCAKLPRIRLFIDRLVTKAPVLKRYSQSYNAIRYTGTLHILFQSGVPLTEAMAIASGVVTNCYIRQKLERATSRVREGSSLTHALAPIEAIPKVFLHMVRSGETSGKLGPMLEKVSSSQERELQRRIATLLGLFGPATLLIMGGVVLLIVMAILLPILNMNQLIA